MSEKAKNQKAPKKPANSKTNVRQSTRPRRRNNRNRPVPIQKSLPVVPKQDKPGDIDLKFSDNGPKPAATATMTTPIQCGIDNQALSTYPCGITSNLMALSKVITQDFYGFYYALVVDYQKILLGATPALQSRFKYLNKYLPAYAPKSVPPRNPKYSYSWINPGSSIAPVSLVNVRNYNWCAYIPSGSDEFVMQQFVAPPNIPNIDAALQQYSTVLQQAAGHQKNVDTSSLSVQLVSEASKKYEGDVSPFALSYPAIGEGSTDSSSVYGTTEAELPFKSNIMGNVCSFIANTSRTSNFIKNNSGDINFAMSAPFIPQYNTKYNDTVHPVKFKFIDFDEIYLFCLAWIGSAFQKAGRAIVPFVDKLLYFALRQSVLDVFQTSQNAVQFLSPNTDGTPEKFEAFRCGSNSISRISVGCLVPALLAENLRSLMYRDSHNLNEKYSRDKNAVIYVPVIGRHVNRALPTFSYVDENEILHPVTFPATSINEGLGIEPIDGFSGNQCYNLNSSNVLNMIEIWNETVGKISEFCGLTSQINGSSNACLLAKTRYYDNSTFDFHDVEVPSFMKHSDLARRIQERIDKANQPKVVVPIKVNSKAQTPRPERVLESIERSRVRAYSSISKITDEDESMFDFFIMPFADISVNSVDIPGISQMKWQTQYRETESIRKEAPGQFTTTAMNRYEEIVNAARLSAPGVAKDASDEVLRSIQWLQKTGRGGFLSEILAGASQVAGMFGA